MKRATAALLALVLALGCIWGSGRYFRGQLEGSLQRQLIYDTSLEKNYSPNAFSALRDESSLLVLGSSELTLHEESTHPQLVFGSGNSDFNTVLLGVPGTQSLNQAINLAALSDQMANKKAVFILSPQWFYKPGVYPETFASQFYLQMFDAFMKNERVTDETKRKILRRCKELLVKDPERKKQVETYEKIYLTGDLDPLDYLQLGVGNLFSGLQSDYNVWRTQTYPHQQAEHRYTPFIASVKPSETTVHAGEIDWAALRQQGEEQGKSLCTNNSFYIEDKYYQQLIRARGYTARNSERDSSFKVSPEYDDLRLFLQVAKELGIEIMLVSVPVNGYWYDYTGFPQEDRKQYYQNIRNIAEQNGVQLADYSDREYEPYFLRDIMHLGWKGWAYLDEQIYQFYQAD